MTVSESLAERRGAIDVHQHLWPPELVDRLRARSRAPYLRDWTLHLDGEAPYVVEAAAHDPEARVASDRDAGVALACVSLSAPLGIERLAPPVARPLLQAWHRGVTALPEHFRGWASVCLPDPDLDGLDLLLRGERFVGVQLAATDLATPRAWERVAAVLAVAEEHRKAVLVHPGPIDPAPATGGLPPWWTPVVGYSAQMQAAWWSWHAFAGRSAFPHLRLVFGAGAGLAPLLAERHTLRGGSRTAVDPEVYVDTSGHGVRALESLVRVLGVDPLVLGSDRPYAEPVAHLLGEAATHAVREANPRRLLGLDAAPTTSLTPAHTEGAPRWTSSSLAG